MKILKLTPQNQTAALAEAAAVLQAGGLVVYPTETLYGMAADATNPVAVLRLLQYKGLRDKKPISIAVTDATMADQYVLRNEVAINAYNTFLPGPVTVVSASRGNLAPGIASPSGSVGVRIPGYPLALALVHAFGRPITATSANASNQKRPYAIADILDHTSPEQQALIDLVLDAGTLPTNPSSTIIDTTLETPTVLRQGQLRVPENQRRVSNSPEETQQFGVQFLQRYKNDIGVRPLVFLLFGEMGAGKTQLSKGLIAGLGVADTVNSPTYTLVNEYQFQAEGERYWCYHLDAWRLFSANHVQELGVQQWLERPSVIVMEWAERLDGDLQIFRQNNANIINVQLATIGETQRQIEWREETV